MTVSARMTQAFEDMTDAGQREHLERMHGAGSAVGEQWHRLDHENGPALPQEFTPHTHDKPTRRT